MTQNNLNPQQLSFKKKMANPWLIRLFLLFKIPLGFLAGMKVKYLEADKAISTVPYKWLNRNPFRSMYFGVQGMAAELSTGAIALLAIQGHNPSVAGIVVGFEAQFLKQAKGRVDFTCEQGDEIFSAVEACKNSNEGQTIKIKTVGKTNDGTVVSVFHFTWSFKQRASK